MGLADEGVELDQWAAQDGPGPEFADLPGDYVGLVSRCARDIAAAAAVGD
jgi:hypothetical protein